jgi:hypothetical protein
VAARYSGEVISRVLERLGITPDVAQCIYRALWLRLVVIVIRAYAAARHPGRAQESRTRVS